MSAPGAGGATIDRCAGRLRDHALALDAAALVEELAKDGIVAPAEAGAVRALVAALRARFHHEFLAVKERLGRAWRALEGQDGEASAASSDQRELARDLLATLRRLLARANFVDVPIAEIEQALRERAAFGLQIDLDLGDFEELAAWRRREVRCTKSTEALFGLKRRPVDVVAFDRFCLFARFKDARRFEGKRGEGKLGVRPGGIVVRLFRDVPKHDVEALFPGVRVRMRTFDRALLGLPAAAGVFHMLLFKVGPSLWALGLALAVFLGLRKEEPDLSTKAVGALAGLGLLFAFLFRQWMRLLGRKNLLHRQLAEHLQTCTLDSGFGVLLHLLDEAAEEEAVEALLAWSFARAADARGTPHASGELDERIEAWLARRLGLQIDFEVDDALAKLKELRLVTTRGDGTLAPLPPAAASAELQRQWGELFPKA